MTGMTVTEVQGFGRQAGPHRGVPGCRVHDRLRPQGPHRGARRARPMSTGWPRSSPPPPARARSATARSGSPRSTASSASAPASSTPTLSERHDVTRCDSGPAPSAPGGAGHVPRPIGATGDHHRNPRSARRRRLARGPRPVRRLDRRGRPRGSASCCRRGGRGRRSRPVSPSWRSAATAGASCRCSPTSTWCCCTRGRADIGELADRLWYPIWDARLKLGHSVRTVKEALALAADDLDTATGLLQVRHLAGDRPLTDELARKADLQWRKRAKRWLAAMATRVRERHAAGRRGRLPARARPQGGPGRPAGRARPRLGAGRPVDPVGRPTTPASTTPTTRCSAVRVELHRRTGRPGDRLLLQEQDGGGRRARLRRTPTCSMRAVPHAARTIAWTSDDAWARIESSLTGPLGRARRERDAGRRPAAARRRGRTSPTTSTWPPTPRCALQRGGGGRRTTAPSSTGARSPAWPPRSPAPAAPWTPATRRRARRPAARRPAGARAARSARPAGRLGALHPRVAAACAASRSATPTTASRSTGTCGRPRSVPARSSGRVGRPDLLVLAGLLHDIGKGEPGDHTDNGVRMLATIGAAAWGSTTATPRSSWRCAATTCCWRTWPPGATSTTPPPSTGSPQAVGEPRGAGAAGRPHRGRLAGHRSGGLERLEGRPGAGAGRPASTTCSGGGEAHEVADEFPAAEQRALLAAGRQAVVRRGRHASPSSPPTGRACSAGSPGCCRCTGSGCSTPRSPPRAAGPSRCSGSSRASGPRSRGTRWSPTWTWPWPGAWPSGPGWPTGCAPTASTPRGTRATRERGRARGALRPRRRRPTSTVVEVHAADGLGVLYRITSALADLDLDIVGAPRCRRSAPRWSTRSSCGPATAPRSPTPACWPRPSAPCCTPSPPRPEPAPGLPSPA